MQHGARQLKSNCCKPALHSAAGQGYSCSILNAKCTFVTPSIKITGAHLYTWVERAVAGVHHLVWEHNGDEPNHRASTDLTWLGVRRTGIVSLTPHWNCAKAKCCKTDWSDGQSKTFAKVRAVKQEPIQQSKASKNTSCYLNLPDTCLSQLLFVGVCFNIMIMYHNHWLLCDILLSNSVQRKLN